jgi:sigma-54 dependent transcriptional regulator, acetoin dehydrogenase operon transcriptional activator AcoR
MAGGPMPDDRLSVFRGSLSDLIESRGLRGPPREEISMSWLRSKRAGLDPQHLQIPYIGAIDPEALLLRASRPVVDQLLHDLGTVSMCVMTSDNRGQVLDRRETNRTLAAHLESIDLLAGSDISEQSAGANGIGSALAEGKSILVEGSEHFRDAFMGTACAGAPILEPKSGRILGVIDLTCAVPDAHPLMLPMASQAAREIERHLIDESSLREKLVLQQFLQKQRRVRGPVVFIDARSMLSNAAASRLVDPADEIALRENAQRMISGGRSGFQEIMLTTGRRVLARCEKVLEGRDPIGVMLELRSAQTPGFAGSADCTIDPITRWAELTNTEHNVAEFVIEGFTNRQIAERMFVSPYTVDYHLRSIFRKLGVSSRVELSRVAPRPLAEARG